VGQVLACREVGDRDPVGAVPLLNLVVALLEEADVNLRSGTRNRLDVKACRRRVLRNLGIAVSRRQVVETDILLVVVAALDNPVAVVVADGDVNSVLREDIDLNGVDIRLGRISCRIISIGGAELDVLNDLVDITGYLGVAPRILWDDRHAEINLGGTRGEISIAGTR